MTPRRFGFPPADGEPGDDRTRPGGLVIVDNAFRDGQVVSPTDAETRATEQALELARRMEAYDAVVLPVADGLLVCRRR